MWISQSLFSLTNFKKELYSIILVLILLVYSKPVLAATISSVSKQNVLINTEGDDITVGEEFYLIDPNSNKKRAIIKIKKVVSEKAFAVIIKGSAQTNYLLEIKMVKNSSNFLPETEDSKLHSGEKNEDGSRSPQAPNFLRTLKNSYGVNLKYLMNSMSVAVRNTATSPPLRDTVSLPGNSFGVGAYYDYIATKDVILEGSAFYEQYGGSGTSTIPGCNGGTSKNCDIKIGYLSAYGLAKHYFSEKEYRFWLGLGGGFLLATSKSATAMKESDISVNEVGVLSIGTDIQFSRKNYVPFVLEYALFPSTETVKASFISIKIGWAWNIK